MGAAEMKAGHEEENVNGTSAAPWRQLDGDQRLRPPWSMMIEKVKTKKAGVS